MIYNLKSHISIDVNSKSDSTTMVYCFIIIKNWNLGHPKANALNVSDQTVSFS